LTLDEELSATSCQFSPDMGPPIFGQDGPLAADKAVANQAVIFFEEGDYIRPTEQI